MDNLDPSKISPWLFTAGAGILGRAMFHAVQVQKGARKPLSWALLWDIPVAVSMGWISLGIAIWLDVPWETTISVSLVTAYLGPYSIDMLFTKWTGWKFKDKNDG